MIKFLLASSLLLELTCLAAILNPAVRIAYGIGLLFMHIDIYFCMNIFIRGIAEPYGYLFY